MYLTVCSPREKTSPTPCQKPFFAINTSPRGHQGSGQKQSLANTGVILVCHLSQVINADHGLIKTCVVTVRALQQINVFGHLFFLTKVILINGKNSVNLALAVTVAVIKMMARNHSDAFDLV